MAETYGYRDFLTAGPWTSSSVAQMATNKLSNIFSTLNGWPAKGYVTPKQIMPQFQWDFNFVEEIWGKENPPEAEQFQEVWLAFDGHLNSAHLWIGTAICSKLCFLYAFSQHFTKTYNSSSEDTTTTLQTGLAKYGISDKFRSLVVDVAPHKNEDMLQVARKIGLMFKNLGL